MILKRLCMNITNIDQFEVRLTNNEAEMFAAQELRHRVFVKEFGAKVSLEDNNKNIERDRFDRYCDHLILIDKWSKKCNDTPEIVGTMRLMQSGVARKSIGFYCATEYYLEKLTTQYEKSLEVGRACVDKHYRGNTAIHFLWLGLAEYVMLRKITLIFGVASFQGTDISKYSSALTFLSNNFSAPKNLNFRAKESGYVDMNIVPLNLLDRVLALSQMPSLLKAYLRMGGLVGDGAFVDTKFNTIDVGLMVNTDSLNNKYKDYYDRSVKKT